MHESPLTIGTPRADELGRLVDFFVSDMRDLGRPARREAMRGVAEEMFADPRTHLRVARVDDRPVGVLVAMELHSIKFPGRALWIEELYVDPTERRGGIGRALVEHLLDWAKREGFAGVELEAYRMNTAASILYRTVGFRRLARERYSFDMDEYVAEDA